ncbi:M81 family metallopeptidase [Cohnella suwonensis]|uniref:M81 family metallopeptidase n=1 Tax=Cohnella suwonensis TaxID=696072 RepID=A0ABW0M1F0_9BACL
MRILVGGIVQESNTFSPTRSTMDNFRQHVYLLGDEMRGIRIAVRKLKPLAYPKTDRCPDPNTICRPRLLRELVA